jgi:hypothetical protein
MPAQLIYFIILDCRHVSYTSDSGHLRPTNKKMRVIIIVIALTCFLGVSYGQNVSLEELIVFQTSKNPIKIDSILLKKPKWDCNCIRQFDDIRRNREWIYDPADTLVESAKKDHVKIDDLGNGFSSITKYSTSDRTRGNLIVSQMQKRKFNEEKVKLFSNDSISAKMSFFVAPDVVIQTMIGENRTRNSVRYAFILMDKSDYLKGLTVK